MKYEEMWKWRVLELTPKEQTYHHWIKAAMNNTYWGEYRRISLDNTYESQTLAIL